MTLIAEEEARAQAHRAQLARRNAAVAARERALSGSSSAALTLREAWRPLTDPQPEIDFIDPDGPVVGN